MCWRAYGAPISRGPTLQRWRMRFSVSRIAPYLRAKPAAEQRTQPSKDKLGSVHRKSVELRHIVVANPVSLFFGEVLGVLVKHLLRPRPGGIGVREIACPHQPAHIDEILGLERHPIVLERDGNVLREIFARHALEWRCLHPVAVALVRMV